MTERDELQRKVDSWRQQRDDVEKMRNCATKRVKLQILNASIAKAEKRISQLGA